MATQYSAVLCCLVALSCLGCRVEDPPSRRDIARDDRAEEAQRTPPPPHALAVVDDAERVIESCGQPAGDTTQAIYDKMYNGPVRRMIYFNRQPIVVEFIPSLPEARQSGHEAPFPPELRAPATPPPGSVWRFQAVRMGEREVMTSTRLSIYLPCAALALADEL